MVPLFACQKSCHGGSFGLWLRAKNSSPQPPLIHIHLSESFKVNLNTSSESTLRMTKASSLRFTLYALRFTLLLNSNEGWRGYYFSRGACRARKRTHLTGPDMNNIIIIYIVGTSTQISSE